MSRRALGSSLGVEGFERQHDLSPVFLGGLGFSPTGLANVRGLAENTAPYQVCPREASIVQEVSSFVTPTILSRHEQAHVNPSHRHQESQTLASQRRPLPFIIVTLSFLLDFDVHRRVHAPSDRIKHPSPQSKLALSTGILPLSDDKSGAQKATHHPITTWRTQRRWWGRRGLPVVQTPWGQL